MRVRLRLERLLELTAQSTLSQNHWAIKIGLSRGHWSAIMNGRHPFPSPRTRERMMEVLGVAFDDLFEIDSGPAEGADATFQAALADRYLIEKEVGQGGMGIVYLARDVRHNRPVAVKVVSSEAVSGIGTQQLLKEIRVAARLQHPHILPVYDSGEAAGLPYYVTPYIESGSLRDRLKRDGALPLELVGHLIVGIGDALAHAHDKLILHCDIKPENILLQGRHAFVADFGIARAIHAEVFEWGRRPDLDSSAGTPAYVSPEQASGDRELNARSDVYSLGCVLYEMLTGQAPFHGSTTMETVARRFVESSPDPRAVAPHLSHATAVVVQRAMALDPTVRPGSATEVASAFADSARAGTSRSREIAGRVVARVVGAARRLPGLRPTRRRQTLMDTIVQDLRFAIRSLTRRPAFAAVVALTLALGIGMNTAIFSVLYGVLFQPMPYPDADRLLRVGRTQPTLPGVILPISPANFVDLQPRIETLSAFEAISSRTFMVTGTDASARVTGGRVSWGFLGVLAVPPAMGRPFTAADAEEGAERVVIVSHEFWRDHLGERPDVVGTTIGLDEEPHTVVGVMPVEFHVIGRNDRLWVPYQWTESMLNTRRNNFLQLYGRLAAGRGVEAAIAELHTEWTRLGETHADTFDDSGMSALGMLDAWVEGTRGPLFLLAGAVGMVLLIACANVANLMLARAETRQRELAVRVALGAGRGRLIRQFLTEGLVVSIVGGLIGVAAAIGGVAILITSFGGVVPRSDEVGVSAIALGFSLVVSIVTGLLVGLVPALQARPDHAALKEGARGSGQTTLVRRALVVTEIGMALMLVVGAGLLLRSFWEAQREQLGFDPNGLLVVNAWLPPSRYETSAQSAAFHDQVLAALRARPDVVDAGLTNMVPVRQFGNNITRVNVLGEPDNATSFVEVRAVTPEYFTTLGVPLVGGRMLTRADTLAPGIVINEHLAGLLFGDRDPIGRRLEYGGGSTTQPEIVGVVGNIKAFGPDRRMRPILYYWTNTTSNIMVRTGGDPLALAAGVRTLIGDIDSDVAVYRIESMTDIVDRSLGYRQFQVTLLGLFACVALALGAVGIYGVMSYMVVQRTRELGVRLALGATAGNVLQLVLRQGGALAGLGVLLGLGGAYVLRRVVEGLVFNVSPADPLTYAAVVVILTGVALAACFLPARRAAGVDPMEALRYE